MIIKFYTEGCGPCYALGILLDKLMVDYDEIDIGKDFESAIDHRVLSVPTLLNSATGSRLVGFKDKETVEEWLNDNQD
jgi:thiol-disulfide isomerase/thioredoxin